MFDQKLPIRAPLRGYELVPGAEGAVGLPLEAFLRLYAVDVSGNAVCMRSLQDVLPLVQRVRSQEEAIQLLCIETAPETHFLFPDSPYLDVRVRSVLEEPGDVVKQAAVAVGYRPPSVVADENGFDLTRDLIRTGKVGVVDLVRRKEHLSMAAEYRLIEEIELGQLQNSDVLLEEYE